MIGDLGNQKRERNITKTLKKHKNKVISSKINKDSAEKDTWKEEINRGRERRNKQRKREKK